MTQLGNALNMKLGMDTANLQSGADKAVAITERMAAAQQRAVDKAIKDNERWAASIQRQADTLG